LRSRYTTFLNETYIPDEIVVLSSDLDRTIMSAQLCLAGLYPVLDLKENWNPNITWQPVPLRTVPVKFDNVKKTENFKL